jgi:hypothetical protein
MFSLEMAYANNAICEPLVLWSVTEIQSCRRSTSLTHSLLGSFVGGTTEHKRPTLDAARPRFSISLHFY